MLLDKISDKVRRESERLVSEAMARFGLRSVRIRADEDYDGDPVIVVDAEYDDGGDPIDPEVVTRLQTHVSDRLLAMGEERFPHIRHHFTENQKVVGYR